MHQNLSMQFLKHLYSTFFQKMHFSMPAVISIKSMGDLETAWIGLAHSLIHFFRAACLMHLKMSKTHFLKCKGVTAIIKSNKLLFINYIEVSNTITILKSEEETYITSLLHVHLHYIDDLNFT